MQDHQGLAPLHGALLASAHDMHRVVQGLLEAGANPNLTTRDGDTPLHWTYTRVAACQLILFGADPNARNLERNGIELDVVGHRRNNMVTRKSNRWGFFTGLEEGRGMLDARQIEKSLEDAVLRHRVRPRL